MDNEDVINFENGILTMNVKKFLNTKTENQFVTIEKNNEGTIKKIIMDFAMFENVKFHEIINKAVVDYFNIEFVDEYAESELVDEYLRKYVLKHNDIDIKEIILL